MNEDKLKEILRRHELWLCDEDGGKRAYLRGADLRVADLCDAYLNNADLRVADLRVAYLRNAYLNNADLCGADLRDAYLNNADLRDAYLNNADLRRADLRRADLRRADLRGADLRGAYLRDANLSGAIMGDLHIYQLSRIGSVNRMTTFWADENKVWCGCFVGTFAEWRDKIRETYSDKMCDECPDKVKYRMQYEAALAYFAELAAIDGMPQYKELLEDAK